jgi:HPr kinase/phosphorylase
LGGAGRIVSAAEAVTLIHATCVAVGGLGVLLIGPPGSGKSDLALRLIDSPGIATGGQMLTAQLVADDQVRLARVNDALIAAAPDALAGRLEIRGLGIVRMPYLASVKLGLAVQLRAAATIERLPDPAACRYRALGLSVPEVEIDAMNASAPARVRAAVLHATTS